MKYGDERYGLNGSELRQRRDFLEEVLEKDRALMHAHVDASFDNIVEVMRVMFEEDQNNE